MAIDFEFLSPPTSESARLQAKQNPNGWVYKMDFHYAESEYIPPEAIEGAWEVDSSGTMTGRFKRNPLYRAIVQSDRKLPQYMHDVAKMSKNSWLTEVAEEYRHLFPHAPDEGVVGYWHVDADGKISGAFRPNSSYIRDTQD